MRLLNTETLQLSNDSAHPATHQYAILSHRWQQPEVTFAELNGDPNYLKNDALQTPSAKKIRQACQVARHRDPPVEWIWIDTCCIDKSNAVEEGRCINSMMEWYSKSSVCITFLYDVDGLSTNHPRSEWFDRGWCLQELVAPRYMEFFGRNWNFIGVKHQLANELQHWSGIETKYLTGQAHFSDASVATRMSWMAGRTTTVVEDIAYSLLGLLGVYLAPQYGEGVQAFARLQKTLLETSLDESLFAWTIPQHGLQCYRSLGSSIAWAPKEWGLLAPSPDCFAQSAGIVVDPSKVVSRPFGGIGLTARGVLINSPLKGHTDVMNFLGRPRSHIILILNCWASFDRKAPTMHIELVKREDEYVRVHCEELLQKVGARVPANQTMGVEIPIPYQLTVFQPTFNLR
ncbi:uncharacterized protein K489DRAFT_429954 [Dissoconium aciculare CBS 342.82]|uniref:Heterokaryon incompatibility domain-containing protein n=1 Tax=Dissoconium aciculare CBS 342.82 TaxID=1314786 RepID=A0A6J3M7E2_9PEZI|nr:uncharacterized protein K489DRAFT_429954 [Dissoconium aciculare CBS 342.82]KAF1823925.1 hypothetical protein K489DRAFT_429954 [Dissoconium aciculare CBS 342.82]